MNWCRVLFHDSAIEYLTNNEAKIVNNVQENANNTIHHRRFLFALAILRFVISWHLFMLFLYLPIININFLYVYIRSVCIFRGRRYLQRLQSGEREKWKLLFWLQILFMTKVVKPIVIKQYVFVNRLIATFRLDCF
jgi:ABC-type multidrug transport system fused ATPase/permease subunit